MKTASAAALGLALAMPAASASAATITGLPYVNSPNWTEVRFSGTSMTVSGNTATLTTANGAGVWFGWADYVGDTPSWRPGSSSEGNSIYLDAAYSANAADWDFYFYDGTSFASIIISPTGCSDNCYGQPAFVGAELIFSDGLGGMRRDRIALDMTQFTTLGFHMADGVVNYTVGGNVYSGAAFASQRGSPLLVVGDGSGSTRTGVGSMTFRAPVFDNAAGPVPPVGAVPEPATWAMLIVGFGLVGGAMRHARRLAPAMRYA